MREILFKGKSVETGEWVYGFFVSYMDYGNQLETYIFEQEQVNRGIDLGGYLDCCKMTEVIPETVGQFTGMTDMDGNKIFEGDIMRNHGNIVEFCSDGFCINGDCPLYYWTKTKIIGNVHDNLIPMEEQK